MIQLSQSELKVMHNDRRLGELLDVLDQLHSAASEGELEAFSARNARELTAWLSELIYTAQETIDELDRNNGRSEVVLRLVEKSSA